MTSTDQGDFPFVHLQDIGGSVGLVLSEALLATLKLAAGDRLYLNVDDARSLRLTTRRPVETMGIVIAREAFRTYAETFTALAE